MINLTFLISSLLAAVICLAAAIIDIKKTRIPNIITFPAIITGLIITAFERSASDLIISVTVIVALFFIGMLNIIGLGDIKLLMAVTALCGAKMCGYSFIIGIMLLCLYAVIFNPIETYIYIKKWKQRYKFKKVAVNRDSTSYPFAPFLFLGIMIYFLFLDINSPFYANINLI